MKIIIPGELPDLNTYINAERSNKFAGATLKKEWTNICAWEAKSQCKQQFDKVFITYHWYCKNKRKDLDNICYAKKFCNDGLVNAGILLNDGWNNVTGFLDKFYIDKDNPRVEVEIEERS